MLNQIQVGTQSGSDGQNIIARAGKQGDQICSDLHGRYYESTYRGGCYNVATSALVTTTVGLATTYTGLVLSNPVTSTVNLEILRASYMQSVIQSVQVEAFALAVGYNQNTNVTHTTPVSPKSNKVGSGTTAVGLADVSATLPTAPLYHTFLGNTATATSNGPGVQIDLSGSIILIPGAYILFATPAQASVAGMWFSFDWVEVPV